MVARHRVVPVDLVEVSLGMDAAACMPEDFKKLLALGLQNARRISTVDQDSREILAAMGISAVLELEEVNYLPAARSKCLPSLPSTVEEQAAQEGEYSLAVINNLDAVDKILARDQGNLTQIKLLMGARARADLRCAEVAQRLLNDPRCRVESTMIDSEAAFFPLLERASQVLTDDPMLVRYCEHQGFAVAMP